ncbi:hypothetical protein [Lactobacillus intestinalis]|uniref:hypothetical protein n=1 Tax=Lactobacillus intestinalis TaxID=151781 RepID=UPI003F681288
MRAKFLCFFMSVVVCFFLFLPTKVLAVDTFSYYTYYFDKSVPITFVWNGSTGFVPLVYDFTFSDVLGGHAVDSDIVSITWFTRYNSSIIGSVSGDLSRIVDYPSSSNFFTIPNLGGVQHPIPFYSLSNPIVDMYPQSTGFLNPNTIIVHTNNVIRFLGTSARQNVTVTFLFKGYFTLNRRIDLTSVNSHLISINSTMQDVRKSLSSLQGAMQQGFSNIDSRLLAILNAINNSSSSGGGTAAIVGAINGTTAAVGQVIAQQKASSADIVGAIGGQTEVLNATLDLIDRSVQNVTDELKRQAEETLASVQKGHEIMGMATQVVGEVRTKWDALLVPLDFTRQIFEVFSGGTQSAAYTESYADVLGYKYNTDTGGLEPIRRRYKQDVPKAVSGTIITFPSFSLDVPSVGTLKLWDEYSFDIATIKQGFPVIFDAIYLVSGILMIYWVIAHLINLLEDLIG